MNFPTLNQNLKMFELLIELKWIDPWMWKTWKKDKPWSTAIWFVMVVAVGYVIQYVLDFNYLLSYVVLSLGIRFALFNYFYNWIYKKPWDYLGLDWWDRMKSSIVLPARIFFEFVALLIAVMQFLYLACLLYAGNEYTSITFEILRYCER